MTVSEIEQQTLAALKHLASVCDMAVAKDGHGFNGKDADFGHSLAKCNRLSPKQLSAGLRMLQTYRGQVEGAGLPLPRPEDIPAQATAAAQPKVNNIAVVTADGMIEVKTSWPVSDDLLAFLREVRDRTGSPGWDKPRKVWVFTGDAIASISARTDIVVDRKSSEAIRQQAEIEAEQRKSALQKAIEAARLTDPLPDGRLPFPQQREGVMFALAHNTRAILAMKVGTGKTLTALLTARGRGLPVVAIVPVSLIEAWQREAEAVGVDIFTFSWGKVPSIGEIGNALRLAGHNGYILVCDEAHRNGGMRHHGWEGRNKKTGAIEVKGSKRTFKVLKLAKSQDCKGFLALTGTPMPNGRPENLYSMLSACDHWVARDKRGYEITYCAGHFDEFNTRQRGLVRVWNTSGGSNLDKLRNNIADVMYRAERTRTNGFVRLPPRQVEASPAAAAQYRKSLAATRDSYERRLAAGEIKSGADALVELNMLRQASEIAKAEYASELAQEIIDNEGDQVILFFAFKEALEAVRSAIGDDKCIVITGETPQAQRQPLVDAFQRGEKRVALCTLGAGGTGLNMQAANYVILVSRGLTPDEIEQAEGRADRAGQTRDVSSIWLRFNGTDDKLDAMLQKKQEIIDKIMAGKRRTLRGDPSIADVAAELVESILGESAKTFEEEGDE